MVYRRLVKVDLAVRVDASCLDKLLEMAANPTFAGASGDEVVGAAARGGRDSCKKVVVKVLLDDARRGQSASGEVAAADPVGAWGMVMVIVFIFTIRAFYAQGTRALG